MARTADLRSHLPSLYSDGPLIGSFTDTWGVQLEMLDEATRRVQRSHWFDSTPSLAEAVALAALVNIGLEEFHSGLGEYRAWVHAMTDARLHGGAVTREALRILVDTYTQGFQDANSMDMVPSFDSWDTTQDVFGALGPSLVENPPLFRHTRLPEHGGWEALATLEITNAGIDPARWAIVLTGHPHGTEYSPLIANRTTGSAIVFRGSLAVGSRLTIAPSAADPMLLKADLDGSDATGLLDSYPTYIGGPDGPGVRADVNPVPTLALGSNELWFLPLAHYDTEGLGRFLLALAEDSLRQGRFDETLYDESLFIQYAHMSGWVAWVEHGPANLEVHLPTQALLANPRSTEDAIAAMHRLEIGLDSAVNSTAAAGVRADVVMNAHPDRQPSQARLAAVLPRTITQLGPTGADVLADGDGRFSLTEFNESVMR